MLKLLRSLSAGNSGMNALRKSRSALARPSLLICAGIILLSGCAASRPQPPPKPEGLFPETVGRFKFVNAEDGREEVYQHGKRRFERYPTWKGTYADGADNLSVEASVHPSADDVTTELPHLSKCYDPFTKLDVNKFMEVPLKDGSGKAVGVMAVCFFKRTKQPNEEGDEGLDDYGQSLTFTNDNRTYKVRTEKGGSPAAVAEFVKALPFYQGADLSPMERFVKANATKAPTYKEMFDSPPPLKLARAPYLKGRVLVLERDATRVESNTRVSNFSESYIKDPERRALLPEEVGSIVRIDCKRGKKVGDYKMGETLIPTYASICEVLVIDNTVPAVIAKKTFTSDQMLDVTTITTGKSGTPPKEYVIAKPTMDIEGFIRSLPAA